MATRFTDEAYFPSEFGGTGSDDNIGYYRYITFTDLLNNFMFAKTGEGKVLGKQNRNLVAYHLQRSIQELNYDTLRVQRSFQIELNTTTRAVAVPQDLVNLIQVSWLDAAGNKHPMIHSETSGGQAILQEDDFTYTYDDDGKLLASKPSTSVSRFQDPNDPDYSVSRQGYFYGAGFNDFEYPYSGGYLKRYGLEPERATNNGRYIYDIERGVIYFDDSIVSLPNNTVIALDYITDGLADDDTIQVNKMVESTVYKMAELSLLSDKEGVQEYVLRRVKKEASAMERNAKIRLMNLNFHELSQAVRAQSKWIKH